MADLLTIDIEKRLAGFRLSVKLTIGAEIVVLFGPSGSGKTQTLNAIAGLTTPDRGEIRLDDRCFFRRGLPGPEIDLPARNRRIGMVFQQYALFPHLSARENVRYPLRDSRDADSRTDALLRRMRLEGLGERYPHELSGGQQQRVAIARALAAEPRVLLLDEPFSALDRPIREQFHQELATLQEETGLAVIYVTHSLDDALAAGHRMVILNHGMIEQVATTQEIFSRPRSRTVLEILGAPNIFEADLIGSTLDWNGISLVIERPTPERRRRVTGYIPAEDLIVIPELTPQRIVNELHGVVERCQSAGLFQRIRVLLKNGCFLEVVARPGRNDDGRYKIGSAIRLALPPDRFILVEPDC